jgi:hypothetical protein
MDAVEILEELSELLRSKKALDEAKAFAAKVSDPIIQIKVDVSSIEPATVRKKTSNIRIEKEKFGTLYYLLEKDLQRKINLLGNAIKFLKF